MYIPIYTIRGNTAVYNITTIAAAAAAGAGADALF